MELKTLSDQELFDLMQDKKSDQEVLEAAKKEFLQRDLTIEIVDNLGMNYEAKRIKLNNKGLSLSQKGTIIIFPFIPLLQTIIANKYLAKNNLKSWEQHWNYVILGFACWTIVIIFFTRFFLLK